MNGMTIEQQIVSPAREELAVLLRQYNAKFHYDERTGLWSLYGTTVDGLAWETDDYEADNLASAWADASDYLIEYNS